MEGERMVFRVAEKESALWKCARMILADQCPPDNKHYLCMKQEDDTPDCTLCWCNYLEGIAAGAIELPKNARRVTV